MSSKPKNESSESTIEKTEHDIIVKSLLNHEYDYRTRSRVSDSFDEFVDERVLISHDIFNKKEMKMKILELSDQPQHLLWKFGDRVKVNKVLITIKHLEKQKIEEAEFDLEAIEKELIEKRHYSSTNRWLPTSEIRNGYVTGSRHTQLISDASALDYITF